MRCAWAGARWRSPTTLASRRCRAPVSGIALDPRGSKREASLGTPQRDLDAVWARLSGLKLTGGTPARKLNVVADTGLEGGLVGDA